MTNILAAALLVIAAVESNNRDDAVGDGGRALGRYQITPIYVRDVNRIYGTNYQHKEVRDPGKGRRVAELYLMHYGRRVPGVTVRDLVRIHNGGPSGWRKQVTLGHWRKACRGC